MRLAAAVLAVSVALSLEAQDKKGSIGQKPKEINAQGWINSDPLTLEKCKGKVVFLEFWATW
jgi:hypothetical protein